MEVVAVPDFRLADAERQSGGVTIEEVEIGPWTRTYYPKDHPESTNTGDWNPGFSVQMVNNTFDPLNITIKWYLNERISENYLGEVSGQASAQSGLTLEENFSYQDMVDKGFETGVKHDVLGALSYGGEINDFSAGQITLASTTPDPENVTVFACSVDPNPVPVNGEATLYAQVTNDNSGTVNADVEWYADGTLIGFTDLDIPPNTGKEASTTGVSHGYLLDRAGSGDSTLSVEVVDVSAP